MSFATPTVTALAHRGFSGGGQGHELENSMAAFQAAVDLGFDWVETDVHATADGVLLAFHDDVLDRTTDGTGVIAQLPYDEVAKARIAGTEPIPKLTDILERWPDLNINIDVKSEGAIEPLVAAIEDHQAHDRVRVASFSDARRRAVLSKLSRPTKSSPGQTTMALIWFASWLPAPLRRPVIKLLARDIDALQIPEKHGRITVLTDRLLNAAHEAGLDVHVWTINAEADMRRLIARGVDGLISDRADIVKNVLSTPRSAS